MRTQTSSAERSLRKSLRLPRSFPRVARWLFDESDRAFHRDAPFLSAHSFTTSFALQIRDHWQNFGWIFDPFQIEELIPGAAEQETKPTPNTDGISSICISDLDMVFTPVTFATPNIVLGYNFCCGSSFDREAKTVATGTFKGRCHILGRFAYDMDNDHTVIIYHGLTPYVSGMIDLTSNGLSRSRFFYTLANKKYDDGKLPTVPLSMMSFTELKSEFEGLFSTSEGGNDENQDGKNLFPDVRFRDGDIDDHGGLTSEVGLRCDGVVLSSRYMSDLMEMTSKLNNLSFVMTGRYSGTNVNRTILRSPFQGEIGKEHVGSVFTEHLQLSRKERREVICNIWQIYSSMAFGLNSERREVGLVSYGTKDSETRIERRHGACAGSGGMEENSEILEGGIRRVKKVGRKSSGRSKTKSLAAGNESILQRMSISFLTDENQ